MPHQFIFTTGRQRVRPGSIGPDIGAALFFGHRHADGQAFFGKIRNIPLVILTGGYFRQPVSGKFRSMRQRRYRGKCHGKRATCAGISLHMLIHQRSPGNMGTRLRRCPRQRMHAGGDGGLHQLMISRLKANLINPVAKTVMRVKFRQIPVCQYPGLCQFTATQGAVVAQSGIGVVTFKTRGPVLQCQV